MAIIPSRPVRPEIITRIATNGHKMDYEVVGTYEDGTPQTNPTNAGHSDRCPCVTASREDL